MFSTILAKGIDKGNLMWYNNITANGNDYEWHPSGVRGIEFGITGQTAIYGFAKGNNKG